MTRARFCAGRRRRWASASSARARAVINAPRDRDALRAEIVAMREKVRAAQPASARPLRRQAQRGRHGGRGVRGAVPGAVARPTRIPGLVPNVGNIALLQRAEDGRPAARRRRRGRGRAYRELRRVQHRARLNEEPTQFAEETLAAERDAVLALWRAVFGPGA